MCEHVIFDNPQLDNLNNEGQRAPNSRKSQVFSDSKSFPDLGWIFKSILARSGVHFGNILVIQTRSKKESKNREQKIAPRRVLRAKRVSKGTPDKPSLAWEREARLSLGIKFRCHAHSGNTHEGRPS